MNPSHDVVVIDGCMFSESDFPGYTERLSAVKLDAFIFTVPNSGRGFREAARSIGHIHEVVGRHAKRLKVARSAGDVATLGDPRTAVILAFQDPKAIENEIDLLRVFYELGVRVLELTYNKANYIGTGCAETEDRGLTDFGRRVVREMNRLGIVIDLSHCSRRTALDAIRESEQPVLFTHANLRSVADNPRNRSDEELEELAARGGVLGLTPWGPICWKRTLDEPPTLDDYLDHVERAVALMGIDHVGFGTDNTVNGSGDEEGTRHQSRLYPEVVAEYDRRVGTKPAVRYARGFSGVHEVGNVTEGLQRRGFASQDVEKFLGRNFLRVFEQVWKS